LTSCGELWVSFHLRVMQRFFPVKSLSNFLHRGPSPCSLPLLSSLLSFSCPARRRGVRRLQYSVSTESRTQVVSVFFRVSVPFCRPDPHYPLRTFPTTFGAGVGYKRLPRFHQEQSQFEPPVFLIRQSCARYHALLLSIFGLVGCSPPNFHTRFDIMNYPPPFLLTLMISALLLLCRPLPPVGIGATRSQQIEFPFHTGPQAHGAIFPSMFSLHDPVPPYLRLAA